MFLLRESAKPSYQRGLFYFQASEEKENLIFFF
jgi:hypothetical protein